MLLSPYLSFNGSCAEAFRFYERILGGQIKAMVTYKETPMAEQVGAEWQDKVIHASLMVGPVLLMGGDPPPGRFVPPAGVSVSIGVDDPAEAERLFAGLAEEGTVCMPIGETFWAVRFGMVTDRFGIPWMVNCEKR